MLDKTPFFLLSRDAVEETGGAWTFGGVYAERRRRTQDRLRV